MQKTLTILALIASAALPTRAATNVGISIGISGPGQYGRIDISNYPQPVLVNPQPIIVAPTPVAVYQRPIYLYVPHTHQVDWGRYCNRYGACGQPVYFVQESWVRDEYHHRHGKHDGHKFKGRDDDGPGRGRGRGRGHDHHHDHDD